MHRFFSWSCGKPRRRETPYKQGSSLSWNAFGRNRRLGLLQPPPRRRPAARAQASREEEEDIQGEIPPKVSDIAPQFVGLPQEEIVKIFQNKYKPINFYRLRHMRGLTFEAYRNKEKIGIEDGLLKLRKALGTYKDYRSSFYKVYLKAFINYTSILVSLFGATAPQLQPALTRFYELILQLSKFYDWKEALLSLAIEVHS